MAEAERLNRISSSLFDLHKEVGVLAERVLEQGEAETDPLHSCVKHLELMLERAARQ